MALQSIIGRPKFDRLTINLCHMQGLSLAPKDIVTMSVEQRVDFRTNETAEDYRLPVIFGPAEQQKGKGRLGLSTAKVTARLWQPIKDERIQQYMNFEHDRANGKRIIRRLSLPRVRWNAGEMKVNRVVSKQESFNTCNLFCAGQ